MNDKKCQYCQKSAIRDEWVAGNLEMIQIWLCDECEVKKDV